MFGLKSLFHRAQKNLPVADNTPSEIEKKFINKVLNYWYLLAFLEQEHQPDESLKQDLKKSRRINTRQVFINYPYTSNNTAPLECVPPFVLQNAKANGWDGCSNVYTLHIGMMRRFVAVERLVEKLNLEYEYRPESDPGYEKSTEPLTIATLQLDSSGKYIEGSFSLSKSLWLLKVVIEDRRLIFSPDFDPGKAYMACLNEANAVIRDKISLNESFGKIIGTEFEGVDKKAIHCGRLKLITQYIVANYVNKILCDRPLELSPLDPALEKKESDINLLCYIDCSFNSKQYKSKDSEENFSALSMDFFSDDLKLVRDRILEKSPYPMCQGLIDYLLSPIKDFKEEDRINVLPDSKEELSSVLSKVLDPRLYPAGKWPSKHSPALMQEVAVNLICSNIKVQPEDLSEDVDSRLRLSIQNDTGYHLPKNVFQEAIFSVNGPPGTGKTTMLKEIVVNNVVERAKLLSCYKDPDAAFDAHPFTAKRGNMTCYAYYPNNKADTTAGGYYDRHIPNWYSFKNDRINDFGIVVTSSNNAAVNNISKEFPDLDNLFRGLDFKPDNPDSESNSQDPALQEVARLFCRSTTAGSIIHKIKDSGSITENEEQDVFFDEIAKSLFSKNHKKTDKTTSTRTDLKNENTGEPPSSEPSPAIGEKRVWGLCAAPFGRKSNIKKYLRSVVDNLLESYSSDIKHYEKARNDFLCQLEKVDSIRREQEKIASACTRGDALSDLGAQVSSQCLRLDEEFVTQATDKSNRQVQAKLHAQNPYTPENYNREREKLFFYALQLTKHFVLTSKAVRSNIRMYYYAYLNTNSEGKKVLLSQRDQETALPSLFQSVFLLTPVLSSTFASIGRCFRKITSPGTIGMLIVDEAGQAQPFYALGALFRSRRAVIVGDPKQIEPVVTDELNYLRKACTDPELDMYKDTASSVQSFADNINMFGTYIEDHSVPDFSPAFKQWVGCPLVVHRRCIDPMFSISNSISYGGMMKQQTMPPADAEARLLYGSDSLWIDIINGKEKGGSNHYVEEQGNAAVEILQELVRLDPKIGSKRNCVYLISPFKSVVAGLKHRIQQDSLLTDSKLDKNWCNENIGTVHTFQGKEASTVIFVIGCSSDTTGAIAWISSNIINVAVTRAKYRLFVIGDKDVCMNNNLYLKEVADKLAYRIPDADHQGLSGHSSTKKDDRKVAVCPICKQKSLVRNLSKSNKYYWFCSNHHANKKIVIMDDDNGRPAIFTCPKCNGVLVRQVHDNVPSYKCLTSNCYVDSDYKPS